MTFSVLSSESRKHFLSGGRQLQSHLQRISTDNVLWEISGWYSKRNKRKQTSKNTLVHSGKQSTIDKMRKTELECCQISQFSGRIKIKIFNIIKEIKVKF